MTKRASTSTQQADMFAATFEDLPLWSGTAQTVSEEVFQARPIQQQPVMAGFERDWAETARVLKANANKKTSSRKG